MPVLQSKTKQIEETRTTNIYIEISTYHNTISSIDTDDADGRHRL